VLLAGGDVFAGALLVEGGHGEAGVFQWLAPSIQHF
jgi:hypothetical protein